MTDKYIYLDSNFAKAEIAKLIEAYPELSEDETLRTDMIAGETNAYRIIERALQERQEAEALASAIKGQISDMTARHGRYERKSAAMRTLIRHIMEAAGLDTLQLPVATISRRAASTSVSIANPDDLPQGYFTTVRKPDSAAIKSALIAGDTIPGAFLVSGTPGLTIRTK